MIKKLFAVLGVFLLAGGLVFAQQKISGKVTDANGEGLVGVSVLVKGTTSGTVTNLDGSWSLNSVKKGATLVFSSIGFASKNSNNERRGTIFNYNPALVR